MTKQRSRGLRSYGLVCDVGGTNVRFGICGLDEPARPRIDASVSFPAKDYASLVDAARQYLAGLHVSTPPAAAVFAVAGPVNDGRVHLTNSGWEFTARELQRGLHAGSVRIVNDFEALARSLPLLGQRDTRQIGPRRQTTPRLQRSSRTVAILGPGTGLGVGGLVCKAGSVAPLVSEGGHVGFAPADDLEIQIWRILRRRFGRVSAERILSGPGLLNLHGAMAEIEGAPGEELEPEAITAHARTDPNSLCGRVFARFCAMLGTVAGDVALTMGARGGVFMAGGLLADMPQMLNASDFRNRFESKGRLKEYMRRIPTRLIVRPNAALLGAASLLTGA